MVNEQQRSFYFICLLVLMNQAPDLLPPFSSYYEAVPYLMRWTIDLVSLVLIIVVSGWNNPRPVYALLIISVQALSLANHAIMLSMNLLIQHWPYEEFAVVHDYYKPGLEKAFYAKLVVLLWGGHELFKQYTSSNSMPFGYGADFGLRNLFTRR